MFLLQHTIVEIIPFNIIARHNFKFNTTPQQIYNQRFTRQCLMPVILNTIWLGEKMSAILEFNHLNKTHFFR